MKTQKFILGAVAAILLTAGNLFANEGDAYNAARNDLKKEISQKIERIPFTDVYDPYVSNVVYLSFKVNEDGELVNISARSENKDLAHFTQVAIANSDLKADPLLYGHGYTLKLNFKDGTQPIY